MRDPTARCIAAEIVTCDWELRHDQPRLLVLSLGGTITMVPSDSCGIEPKLGAAELVASVPALADVAEIEARSPA